MTTNIRDPRSIVTPDAFDVSEEMLGLPLAPPGRRAMAMFVDLVVIGLITAFVSGWGFFVWGVIGLAMVQLAFRTPAGSWTTGQLGQVTAWAYRGSVGCLGLVILFTIALVWIGSRVEVDGERVRQAAEQLAEVEGVAGVEGIEDPDRLRDLAADLQGVEADAGPEVVDSVIGVAAADLGAADVATELTRLRSPGAPDSVTVAGGTIPRQTWEDALRTRAIALFASDTVATLQRTTTRQAGQIDSLRDDLAAAEEAADSGFLALVRELFDQLGSAFGVWTLYFTVATVVLRGRTVGKLAARIRVVRLDGEPLTWLPSLERAGGYAAGVATGLMGFMRVFWDRNRQCVHDRIVGTVVVLEGAQAIPGSWDEVWTESEAEEEAGR